MWILTTVFYSIFRRTEGFGFRTTSEIISVISENISEIISENVYSRFSETVEETSVFGAAVDICNIVSKLFAVQF